jgi:CO dehydrogenase nickel-insertion accessory protein CooC1
MVEPSAKSIDVARRAALIIAERHIGMILAVANRVCSDDDLQLIRTSIPGVEILTVPDDPLIAHSDREAKSPLDLAPDGAGVSAMRAVAQRLERWARQSSPDRSLTVL